jgi:hypothetical protein
MRLIFFILGVFFSISAIAQSTEYIVLNNGDTLKGKVKILNHTISVIKAKGDTNIVNSRDVALYVNGKTQKKVLQLILYGYSENIEEIQTPNYVDPVYDTTVLLRSIITGQKMNLYGCKDKNGVVYFFVKKQQDSVPVQLLYVVGGHMPEKASWGEHYQLVNYINHYRIFESQLGEMTSDCDYITEGHLQMINYLESSLKAFINRYNKHCN